MFWYTVPFSQSRSSCILCYDLRVLWPAKNTVKSHPAPLSFRLLTGINWNFKWVTIAQRPSSNGCKTAESWPSWKKSGKIPQLTFRTWFYIENCCFSSDPGLNPGWHKLWELKILKPLSLQGHKLYPLKDLIYFRREKELCNTFKTFYTNSKYH